MARPPRFHLCTERAREYWMFYRGASILAVVWFGSPPTPSPPPLSSASFLFGPSSCVSPVELTDRRVGRRGWTSSQIIRPRESLTLYKSFNTLWKGSSFSATAVYTALNALMLWSMSIPSIWLHLPNIYWNLHGVTMSKCTLHRVQVLSIKKIFFFS